MSPDLKSVCVFCGSSEGNDPAFGQAALCMPFAWAYNPSSQGPIAVGEALAKSQLELLYGGKPIHSCAREGIERPIGGTSGIMGATAASVLAHGGKVHGVIPAGEHQHIGARDSVLRMISTDGQRAQIHRSKGHQGKLSSNAMRLCLPLYRSQTSSRNPSTLRKPSRTIVV